MRRFKDFVDDLLDAVMVFCYGAVMVVIALATVFVGGIAFVFAVLVEGVLRGVRLVFGKRRSEDGQGLDD